MSAENPEKKPDFSFDVYLKKPVVERGPCPRNREIFEAVKIHHLSEREAALKFSLSKTRIHQIVEHVAGWIARTGGGPTRTWRERQRVSEYIHRERMDSLYRSAYAAWLNSGPVQTTQVSIEDGKPDRKKVSVKHTQGDTRYWDRAERAEKARHAFEDSRPRPPEVEDMTTLERLREAEEIVAEAARQERTKDQEPMTQETEEYAPLFPEANDEDQDDVAAEEDDQARWSLTNRQQPLTNDPLPPVAGTDGAASSLPTRPTAPEPAAARRPVRGERRLEVFPDEPPPMVLTKNPSQHELMRYYVIDEDDREEFIPPTVEYGRPGDPHWRTYKPLPPASAWQMNWRKKNGVPWRRKKMETE